MATIGQYVTQMGNAQKKIARKLGYDLASGPLEQRVPVLVCDVMIAVVLKALVDKGVVTDAELVAALNSVRDDTYDTQPTDPIPDGG